MKLATMIVDQRPTVVVISNKGFLPISELLPKAPVDVLSAIAAWDEIGILLEEAIHSAISERWRTFTRESLLAPVPRPGKMLAIGLNYVDHVTETGLEAAPHQVWFSKQINSVNGPYADVHLPKVSNEVDFEVELVAVIGKRGRHISQHDAPGHVFGYCVGNDVSARDWQLRSHQWVLGKSFDTHAPFGPWITTADELADPHNLEILCSVNGQQRQRANTGQMRFNVWAQIAHLSEVMTLEPGDVIFTGTPAGVGLGMKPPLYLRPGNIVRCEVENLGFLENRFIPEPIDRPRV